MVRIWDAQTGDAVSGPFERYARGVTSMAFSPDGKHIVLGLVDETLTTRVWEVQTGNTMLILNGPTSTVNTVAFSPD
jgi:WD40 repeat protein